MAANTRSAVMSMIKKVVSTWNVTNFRVTAVPSIACFTAPGLSHESYDRDGNPKVTSLMMTSHIARIRGLYFSHNDSGHFLDWEAMSSDRLMFDSSIEVEISPKLYDPDIPKNVFDMEVSLGNVGNMSLSLPVNMYVPGDKEPIFKETYQLVSVCTKTFKPLALPDWFKDKFKGKGVMSSGLVIKPNPRPAQSFIYKSKVAWSDTDVYNHTNHISYVKYATDGLHAAVLEQGKNQEKTNDHSANLSSSPIKGITEDLFQCGLKKMRICYLNQSREGQNLDTHVWQVDGKERVVFCSVEKDAVPICDMTLEYFEQTQ